jgi:hypothetical protein
MKRLILLLCVTLTASVLQAQDFSETGFSLIKSSSDSLRLKDLSGKELLLSKISFSSEEEASAFCKENNMKLDPDSLTTIMALAMSGAASENDDIKEAITFSFSKNEDVEASGIWAWTGSKNEVHLIQDGNMEAQIVPYKKIELMAEQLGRPGRLLIAAICR